MAAVPICVRFGKIITESCLSVNKNINLRSNYGLNLAKWTSCSQSRSFCTPLSQKPTENSPPPIDADTKQLISQIEDLNKSVEELSNEKAELLDKYKRSLADSENLRRRMAKQIEDAKLFGIQGFCKDLLEVADILSKATECVPKEEVTDKNPHLKNLYEGLTMTEAELKKVFKRHGLELVNPINEKFNPNLHEALFQQEVAGKEPGTVVVVSKPGYKLHERVVRPALVGVAS